MQTEDIRELLPQRYPFLLVDRVVAVDHEANTVDCYKNVSVNENFFNGHFPGHPVMPGVLIIEAMAQAASILGMVMGDKQPDDGMMYYFAGVDQVRFRKPVTPGDRLDLKAQFLAEKMGIRRFSCQALVDGKTVSSAIVTCAKKEMSP